MPICDSENKVPLCARKWYGPGDSDPAKACNGCEGHDSYDDYYDGDAFNAVYVYAGSLIVNPGCIFYGFSDYDFEGTVDEYPAVNGDPAGE